MFEAPVGIDTVFVTYESPDNGGLMSAAWFVQEVVAKDAAIRDADGWEVVSASILPQRQMGSTGNLLFQTGGQYATQLAAVVLYRRR